MLFTCSAVSWRWELIVVRGHVLYMYGQLWTRMGSYVCTLNVGISPKLNSSIVINVPGSFHTDEVLKE